MSKSAICILTAGLGTRVGSIGQIANKAIVSIGHRAAISLILERFDPTLDIVIAVGHNAQIVKDYMAIAHSNRNIHFVDVDKYTGLGSGPGYSLLSCREHLQRPFYFVACDTLWEPVPLPNEVDWMGISDYPGSDTTPFCNLQVTEGKVSSLSDKTSVDPKSYRPFVGLAHIKNYEKFWRGLAAPVKMTQGEHQVSSGFEALVGAAGVHAIHVNWSDLGTQEGLKHANKEAFDFSKTDELLFFENGKVIKFFKDSKIAQDRVHRASKLKNVVPALTDARGQFYAYKFEPGSTCYQGVYDDLFSELLKWLDANLWTPVEVQEETLSAVCHKFYYAKTMQRTDLFRKKYPSLDASLVINGRRVSPLGEMLSSIPWEELKDGRPVNFHGDLHFDNIIMRKNSRFLLIDWRNDFGGQTEFGDLYYDLGKLLGGLFLNYDLIKQNLMWVKQLEEGRYEFDFARRYTYDRLAENLFKFCESRGLDEKRVRILTGIIFLNMAPLHHPPFDLMLFLLSRYWLDRELN